MTLKELMFHCNILIPVPAILGIDITSYMLPITHIMPIIVWPGLRWIPGFAIEDLPGYVIGTDAFPVMWWDEHGAGLADFVQRLSLRQVLACFAMGWRLMGLMGPDHWQWARWYYLFVIIYHISLATLDMYITFMSLDLSCGAYTVTKQLTTVEFLANVVKFPSSRKEKAHRSSYVPGSQGCYYN